MLSHPEWKTFSLKSSGPLFEGTETGVKSPLKGTLTLARLRPDTRLKTMKLRRAILLAVFIV
jgi:hypothetical protein